MNHERVRISTDGRISAVGSEATPSVCTQLNEFELHAGPEGMWLLLRADPNATRQVRVQMMGEITARTTVMEIINLVTSTNWRGELHIAGASGRRVLGVDQGALKHARTDFDGERLGERLIKSGHIARYDLTRVLADTSSDRRLGQQLVEASLLKEDVLFKELQLQAEAIFYAALIETSGMYWFVAPGEDAPPPSLTLHLPIHALLMEGVQRIDEMALYRERVPNNRLFPFVPPEARKPAKDTNTNTVLALCDGKHNIDAISRKTSLGEFATVKAVHALLRSHKAQLLSGPSVDPRVTTRLIRLTNDIMRDIFIAVGTYGRMELTQHAVSTWLADSAHGRILGSAVDVDGTLDRAKVHGLLEQNGGDDPMGSLHQALHELCAFALFSSSQHLPRRDEQSLTRDVQHRLKQLAL